mmetsp:Transcript_14321/g.41987  ORF Transcript_14321/g.41987 Transcript_14321/m.41987 type:complete len:226 (-) Transcript_14321:122-799(-)
MTKRPRSRSSSGPGTSWTGRPESTLPRRSYSRQSPSSRRRATRPCRWRGDWTAHPTWTTRRGTTRSCVSTDPSSFASTASPPPSGSRPMTTGLTSTRGGTSSRRSLGSGPKCSRGGPKGRASPLPSCSGRPTGTRPTPRGRAAGRVCASSSSRRLRGRRTSHGVRKGRWRGTGLHRSPAAAVPRHRRPKRGRPPRKGASRCSWRRRLGEICASGRGGATWTTTRW